MEENGVLVFPNAGAGSTTPGIDPNLLALINQNGGFGNNGAWLWIMFLWLIWGVNGNGFGNGFGNGGGTGFIANQMNNDVGRDLLMQAIQGNRDAIAQLANMLNTNIASIQSGVNSINNSITSIGGQIGMSGLQTINAIQAGNASISSQLCKCCCDNQLAICQQTNTLQAEMARNAAAQQLQFAQAQGEDRLTVCQQTNQLGSQADRNTNTIVKAIADQNAMIVKEFCDLKERELQNKIDTQGDIITQLRGQISNDKQTEALNAAISALNEKIALLAAKQPNTVPVQYPNIVAANATPYVGYNMGYPQNNFWG